MRVAIIHDWLNQHGGAELVLEVLHEMFPLAPIYTSIYDSRAMPSAYRTWDIRTSFMQRLPWVKRHHQPFLPLYPLAFARFDLSDYDLVISNSSGFCHGVATPPQTCHINYCLTPPRFLWLLDRYLERERIAAPLRWALRPFIARLRGWDYAAAQRIDHFIGISKAVVGRIAQFYSRSAALVYPPVHTSRFSCALASEVGDYFLVVSRLVPYKRVDLAVQAFNELGLPLLIVGEGRDRRTLQGMARSNVRFAGRVPDEELRELLARCQAFVFPGEDDFGIAPLEAQAAGRPVIAYAAGGALETVVEGKTGLFFQEASANALTTTVRRFEEQTFDPQLIRRHAQTFDTEVFKTRFQAFVAAKIEEHRRRPEADRGGY